MPESAEYQRPAFIALKDQTGNYVRHFPITVQISAIRCIKTGVPASRQHQGNAGQKAPSAKRCIKTHIMMGFSQRMLSCCQKALCAKRCIKTQKELRLCCTRCGQKAPSTKRRIKTLPLWMPPSSVSIWSESTEHNKAH